MIEAAIVYSQAERTVFLLDKEEWGCRAEDWEG
jgi:hypothetical protein